jgi:hypothetical protein
MSVLIRVVETITIFLKEQVELGHFCFVTVTGFQSWKGNRDITDPPPHHSGESVKALR